MIEVTRLEAEHLVETLRTAVNYPDDDNTEQLEQSLEIVEALLNREDKDFEQTLLDS